VFVLETLFDPGVVLHSGDPDELGSLTALYPEERRAIERAVEKRQREYAATRVLARRAFHTLGMDPVALLNHEDRSPVWPSGLVGSLTHTEGFCAVVVARGERFRGVGIDAERHGRVEQQLFGHVLTARELEFVRSLPPKEQSQAATVIFSAKESLYKCQFPTTRKFVGFHEVEVELDLARSTFSTRFLVAVGSVPAGATLGGRCAFLENHVVTAVAWSSGPAAPSAP
jgi:4'-phosphopantetheinyl transferase EntD